MVAGQGKRSELVLKRSVKDESIESYICICRLYFQDKGHFCRVMHEEILFDPYTLRPLYRLPMPPPRSYIGDDYTYLQVLGREKWYSFPCRLTTLGLKSKTRHIMTTILYRITSTKLSSYLIL